MINKAKYLVTIFAFFYCSLLLSAQQNKIDSLLYLLKSDKQDTTKLIRLYNLSDEYEVVNLFPEGIYYGKQAINLADELYNKNKSEIVKRCALKYKGKSHTNIGIIHRQQGNYSEALRNHFAALKIFEVIGNKRGIASSYNSIGLVYNYLRNFPEALKNHFACLKTFQEMEDQFNVVKSYNNIGMIYSTIDYQKAVNYFSLSLKIRKEIGDSIGMADSYCNLGNMYLFQGKLPEAIESHSASLKIYENFNDSSGIADSYGNIGAVLYKQKKFKEARDYCIKSLTFLKIIGDKESIKHRLSTLTDLDSAQGNYKGAYENHKLFILYSDSLINEETQKKTIQSQMTYDFEKKEAVAGAEHKKELENQEQLATEKSRKQKIVIVFVIIGLILVITFAGFIFQSLRITRKQKDVIEIQKNLVEKQKNEVMHQKHLVEEHQKEIIDSITYARRIQRSLLPTEKYIEKNLIRLKKK